MIGETLRAATDLGAVHDASFSESLRLRISDGDLPSTDYQSFISDPLSVWIEANMGLRREDGTQRLIRATPGSISGNEGAAVQLAAATSLPRDRCDKVLQEMLLASYRCSKNPDTGFPPFAFRLHQFISRGDTVLLAALLPYALLVGGLHRDWPAAFRAVQGSVGGRAGDELHSGAVPFLSLLRSFLRCASVFCRFIATADYVAAALRKSLKKEVEVASVTGELAPAERELRIAALAESPKHVLVATDCLSEGINLQGDFDAVLHYDLSWNPTRHEQREGRVDRYGQPSPKVRAVTYYGTDNQIDGIVLDVLIRKHKKIRSSLGISVPVPVDTEQVIEAVFEGLLLRQKPGNQDQLLLGFEEYFQPQKEALFEKWESSAEREKRSRTMFAQETLSANVEEVERELTAVRAAIGSALDVARFTKDALLAHRAVISENGVVKLDVAECPRALREALQIRDRDAKQGLYSVRFSPPVRPGELCLTRTHPLVEGLAAYLMDTALDAKLDGIARRCGAIRTSAVSRRTTVLLLRLRYHIITRKGSEENPMLAEDSQLVAFVGSPSSAEWLPSGAADSLMGVEPEANINPDQAAAFVAKVIQDFPAIESHLNRFAVERGEELLAAHSRVRIAARLQGVRYRVEPQIPPDVLGVYIFLPAVQGN